MRAECISKLREPWRTEKTKNDDDGDADEDDDDGDLSLIHI